MSIRSSAVQQAAEVLTAALTYPSPCTEFPNTELSTCLSTIMVCQWVSNQSSDTIVVSITNTTGGLSHDWLVFSKPFESWQGNHWSRKGDETATIKYTNGKTIQFTVGKDKFVYVYEDTIVLLDSQVIKV